MGVIARGSLIFAMSAIAAGCLADTHALSDGGLEPAGWQTHGRHHLSVITGGTHISGEGTALTWGLDYEYRVSNVLGLGAVVEHAGGDIDANTVLAVTDIHPFRNNLILQIGAGVESRTGDDKGDSFVARTGVLYEFEREQFTLSPQIHWDWHDRHHNAVVVGVAFGVAF